MTETVKSNSNNAEVTLEDIQELIQEFELYRARLVDDTINTAKKAKLSKQKTMAKLEPELAKIDATIARLRQQAAIFTGNS